MPSVPHQKRPRRSRPRKRAAQHGAGVDAVFRVFADRTRVRILHLLRAGPLCVGDLVVILRAPQPTVSRHLAYLRRSGFVDTQQYGLWIFYKLAPAPTALQRKLLECLTLCARLLPEAASDAGRARSLRRSGGCCPEGRRLMEQSLRGRG